MDGVDVTSIDVGIIVDRVVVDGGRATIEFRLVVDGIAAQADVADVTEDSDIVLDGMVLTVGNSLKLISTKSSYKL